MVPLLCQSGWTELSEQGRDGADVAQPNSGDAALA
jgi:hypothetical protein